MKASTAALLGIGLVVTMALPVVASAGSVTLYSPMMSAPTGDQLICTVVNIGKVAIADLDVTLLDDTGTDITFATQCGLVPLDPGKGCRDYTGGGAPVFGYCKITYSGSKKAVRATLYGATFATGIPNASVPVN